MKSQYQLLSDEFKFWEDDSEQTKSIVQQYDTIRMTKREGDNYARDKNSHGRGI